MTAIIMTMELEDVFVGTEYVRRGPDLALPNGYRAIRATVDGRECIWTVNAYNKVLVVWECTDDEFLDIYNTTANASTISEI